jgi:hypothetical protein
MVFRAWSWKRVAAEIDKCVVRCANCHRRKESEARGLWRQRWMSDHGLLEPGIPSQRQSVGSESRQ